MAAVAQPLVNARQQKNIIVNIKVQPPTPAGGTAPAPIERRFERHVSNMEFAPTSAQETWQGGTPDAQVSATAEPTWQANITCIQAFDQPDSLARLLLEHYGEQATVDYYPHSDTSWGLRTTLTLPAPNVGGAVNKFNESTVQAQCTKPSIITTAPNTVAP